MGIAVPIEESGRQHHQTPTMKAFVASSVIAFAATTGASPAADPALIYSGHGGVVAPVVGTVDTGLKFHPESGVVTPDFTEAQREAEALPPQAGAWGYGYGLPYASGGVNSPYIHYGKRDAEAKSDAWSYGYGLPYAYGGVYSPYIHYGKRDADAKSDAWGYGLGGVYGYPHFYGGVYGGYPNHYGKRDAEAKSDAWGYALGGVYGYPHVYGGVYGGYPYHYGKRDAEAKSLLAKSDAYSYGGYGYPYVGVHTYGFPYGGYPG